MSDLDARLRAYLDSRDEEAKEGYTLKQIVAHFNQRYEYIVNEVMKRDKENRRDHDKYERRLAEHGHRIGHLEVEVSQLKTDVDKLDDSVDEVDRKSGEWKMHHLKETSDKLQWWQRQSVLWLVGVGMLTVGAIITAIVNLILRK